MLNKRILRYYISQNNTFLQFCIVHTYFSNVLNINLIICPLFITKDGNNSNIAKINIILSLYYCYLINEFIVETSGIMSRLFGYTSAVADRDTAAIEAFENKKIEAQGNYKYVMFKQ